MAKKRKYYVVWKGRQSGVFSTWEECSAQVTGFTGAEYKAFDSRGAAEEAFRGQYEDYKGQRTTPLSQEELFRIGLPNPESYSVDASCIGYPGPVEYRCVHTRTRKEIFRQGPLPNGTNNIGEFLGLVHALALLKQKGITLPIYSDSENAIGWVRQKKCRTRLERNETNAELFGLIERAENWLQNNEYENQVLKWETDAWGENPADFGRK